MSAGAPHDESPADFTRTGVLVGHATDADGATGCTVLRGADGPLRGAVAILGRATGTRELALLEPGHLVDRVDALLLAGGSAFGLDAAAGAMRWCEERARGFDVGDGVVPIVPAAVLFDLAPLGRFDARPTAAMAYAACESARADHVAEGSVGAGTGATVGKARGVAGAMKGGVGCATMTRGTHTVGAVVAVNAFGDVCDAAGAVLAGARAEDGAFVGAARAMAGGGVADRFADAAGRNTTLAAVVTSVPLDKLALHSLARAATAALHRRIVPCGTPFDGDVVFALAPRDAASAPPGGITPDPGLAMQLEALAVEVLSAAIERAVRTAHGRDGIPGLADAIAMPSRSP